MSAPELGKLQSLSAQVAGRQCRPAQKSFASHADELSALAQG